MRLSSAIRATAWAVVATGTAIPLVRRRLGLAPVWIPALAGCAPVALCVALPRTRVRDGCACALQMWAYVSAYKTPHDDPQAQAARVRVDYPIAVDRALGLGETPTLRLQAALGRPGVIRALDKPLVWAHWMWFLVPHGTVAYLLIRRPERFARGAVMMYAVFDLGAIVYWALPTAPPWWAAVGGGATAREPAVRRMMAEYGEQFWRDGWGPLYSVFGGNPLAAMPSLHFATSVMAARLLAETGPLAGTLACAYAGVLGFSLVYLGEHYVIDLLAGLALTEGVYRHGGRAAPLLACLGGAIGRLEARAHAAV